MQDVSVPTRITSCNSAAGERWRLGGQDDVPEGCTPGSLMVLRRGEGGFRLCEGLS